MGNHNFPEQILLRETSAGTSTGSLERGLMDDRGLVWGSLEDKPLVDLPPKASLD